MHRLPTLIADDKQCHQDIQRQWVVELPLEAVELPLGVVEPPQEV